MRVVLAVFVVLLFICPAVATGQSVVAHGSAGALVVDSGHNLSHGWNPGLNVSGGAGLTFTPRLALLVDIGHTRRAPQLRTDARGNVYGFRGGSLTTASALLRASLFPPHRIGPYGLVGLGIGLSRLNASATLPDRGTTRFRATTFGGGLHVPLDDHLAIFVEGRMTVGADANELLAVAPISAGFSWRF